MALTEDVAGVGDVCGDNNAEAEDEETERFEELPDLREVVKAKEKDPMMFVSGYDADDDGIVPAESPDTPGERLLQACEEGKNEEVEELIKLDENLINYKDNDGYTALHRACYEDNLQTARILISHGAQVNATSGEGWTPLHSASHWNAYRCVRLLIENGAEINGQTNGGLTPLHLACNNRSARETIIILLTTPGVRIDIENNANETAAQIVKRSGNLDHLFEMHRKSICRI